MAYRDFTLKDLDKKFGIESQVVSLFDVSNIARISASEWLSYSLNLGQQLQLITEKAKSEAIVMPILLELKNRNNNFFTIFSGSTLKVDKERGLNGECDFILSAKPKTPYIDTPIISVVEAKKGELELGMGQCAAQMYAAKLENDEDGKSIDVIYGCVTNGREWQFLKLENNLISIDEKIYPIDQLETILGIFQHIIDYYKSILEPVAA